MNMIATAIFLAWEGLLLGAAPWLWPCGKKTKLAAAGGACVFAVWAYMAHEAGALSPYHLWLVWVTLLYVAAVQVPRITRFRYYDAAEKTEYTGEIYGNPHADPAAWVADIGTMRVTQYKQGWGRAGVRHFALKKKDGAWTSCRIYGLPDANTVSDPHLLETLTRTERRVNRWRLWVNPWRRT